MPLCVPCLFSPRKASQLVSSGTVKSQLIPSGGKHSLGLVPSVTEAHNWFLKGTLVVLCFRHTGLCEPTWVLGL